MEVFTVFQPNEYLILSLFGCAPPYTTLSYTWRWLELTRFYHGCFLLPLEMYVLRNRHNSMFQMEKRGIHWECRPELKCLALGLCGCLPCHLFSEVFQRFCFPHSLTSFPLYLFSILFKCPWPSCLKESCALLRFLHVVSIYIFNLSLCVCLSVSLSVSLSLFILTAEIRAKGLSQSKHAAQQKQTIV